MVLHGTFCRPFRGSFGWGTPIPGLCPGLIYLAPPGASAVTGLFFDRLAQAHSLADACHYFIGNFIRAPGAAGEDIVDVGFVV
jgi:hypothetical protein